jgi:uncharacterized membrane protein YczE
LKVREKSWKKVCIPTDCISASNGSIGFGRIKGTNEGLNVLNVKCPPVVSKLVENWLKFLGRMPSLLLGQFLFSLGVVANLNAGLGGRPWDVLCVGVMGYTPFTLGRVAQVLSLVVLVFGWMLGYPPGFSTVTNTYFIGVFIDLIIVWDVVPLPTKAFLKLELLILAIGLFAAGSLFYLRVGLGAGPRDGLMMGLTEKLGCSISRIRGMMELTLVTLGFLLKGPVGLGTIIIALSLGPAIQLAFRVGRLDSENTEQLSFPRLVSVLRGRGEF